MNKKLKKPELLAPAGSLEKLKIALLYGADAVYFGGGAFSLRATAQKFTYEDIKEAVKFTHDLGKKIYCTVNIMPRSSELENLVIHLKKLDELGVDAVIVSDLGVVSLVKKHTNLAIHISTQANTINYEGCNMWHELGAERIVLARECSFKEIREIKENIPEDLELEIFIHGSMCISYSGRCLLSNYMAGRDSNRGACAQSCRWNYSLVEEKRPNEYFKIEEDKNGTYIMNSKDLCMIKNIPDLIESGVESLKIEGRNKSEYYVALVVKAYRQAIDLYFEDPEQYKLPEEILNEMYKVNHRIYHTGFFYGNPKNEAIIYDTNNHIKDYDMVARVLDYDEDKKIATCIQRNKFSKGETLEILSPHGSNSEFIVTEIFDEEDNLIESCPHPGMKFKIKCSTKVYENSFFRKALNK